MIYKYYLYPHTKFEIPTEMPVQNNAYPPNKAVV